MAAAFSRSIMRAGRILTRRPGVWNIIEPHKYWHDREGFWLKTDVEDFENGAPPFLAP